MTDINEVLKVDGKRLVMLTIGKENIFYLIYPTGEIKEIKKVQRLTKADKNKFIAKLFQIINQ